MESVMSGTFVLVCVLGVLVVTSGAPAQSAQRCSNPSIVLESMMKCYTDAEIPFPRLQHDRLSTVTYRQHQLQLFTQMFKVEGTTVMCRDSFKFMQADLCVNRLNNECMEILGHRLGVADISPFLTDDAQVSKTNDYVCKNAMYYDSKCVTSAANAIFWCITETNARAGWGLSKHDMLCRGYQVALQCMLENIKACGRTSSIYKQAALMMFPPACHE